MGIASIGHGRLGLRGEIIPFSEMAQADGALHEASAKLRPGLIVEDFSLDSSNTWVAPITVTHDKVLRDIVKVRSLLDNGLTRVESRLDCIATPGSYFYDRSQIGVGVRSWDDAITPWWDEQILDVGIVGDWEGSGNNVDASVSGNDLDTNVAAGFSYTAGLQGNCFSGDGINAAKRIQASGIATIDDFGTGDFAFAQKFNITTQTNSVLVRMGLGAGVTAGWSMIFLTAGPALHFNVADGTIPVDIDLGNFATGGWHSYHVVVSRTAKLLWVFTDGVLRSTVTIPGTFGSVSNTSADFGIGVAADDNTGIFNGLLDQTKVWGPGATLYASVEQAQGAALIYHNATAGASPTGVLVPSTGTLSWDVGAGFLYVHLSDGSDVPSTSIMASLGYFVSTRGRVHPELGSDLLTDGEFDVPLLPAWTELKGPEPLTWDNTSVTPGVEGTGALARITTQGAPVVSSWSGYFQNVTGRIKGAQYRLSGYYVTSGEIGTGRIAADPDFFPSFWIGDALGGWIGPDGRTLQNGGVTLRPTRSRVRRFVFDFVAPATTIRIYVAAWRMGAARGTANFDGLKLQRIFGWHFYEPRLGLRSLPKTRIGSRDPFFGQAVVGNSAITIFNGAGDLDSSLAGLKWINQEVELFGAAHRDDWPMSISDAKQAFSGTVQGQESTDEQVGMSLQTSQSAIHRDIPEDLYRSNTISTGSTDPARVGSPRPLLFGDKTGIVPTLLAANTNDLPTYEICDTTKAPNGITAIVSLWAYLDSVSARIDDAARRVLLGSNDFTADLANGRFTLDRQVRVYEITTENNLIDFNEGGAELTAAIAVGVYVIGDSVDAYGLLSAIKVAMELVGAGTYTAAFSNATKKVTLTKSAGTFQLLHDTGTHRGNSALSTLGYDSENNDTGSLSYIADEAIYADASELFIRARAQGFKDDALGTFTGGANQQIVAGSDILRFLWVRILGFDAALIDEASFIDARTNANQILSIYLDSQEGSGDVFEKLAVSNLCRVIIDGEGKIRFIRRTNAPSNTIAMSDADFVSFKEKRTIADSNAAVDILYSKHPETGAFQVVSTSNADAKLTLREDIRQFETYLTDVNDVNVRIGQLLVLLTSSPRILDVRVRSVLDDRILADRVEVNRTRASLSSGGTAVAQSFDVRSLELSLLEPGESRAILVEAINVPGG